MMRRCRPLLGTFVEVECESIEGVDAGFAAIERVHRLMSAHEPESDLSRINRFGHVDCVEVHDWTAHVIERALSWAKRSAGAFDIVRAGKVALERGLLPLHTDQPSAIASCWTCLEIRGTSVRLLKPGCLDLGGIAKGFAVDCAIEEMRRAGCDKGLVNAGGDLRAFGSEGRMISIVTPSTRVPVFVHDLQDAAMATSAGLPSGRDLTFEHLLDARREWSSVTVIAANACDADALTKIVWSRGHEAASSLAVVEAAAFALRADGGIEHIGEKVLAA